ncbi:hypothetical protein BD310DRAFT_353738 [Dichomitus squalens]|uniref:Uncharacterized protein n=1 Tax=Dichomitus squalens TaxID=114155 RepID=A0A4Q9P9Q5_9APHY|nr:hypothetical protein BD310DRAFT_353738 [Dichomitus squalens]
MSRASLSGSSQKRSVESPRRASSLYHHVRPPNQRSVTPCNLPLLLVMGAERALHAHNYTKTTARAACQREQGPTPSVIVYSAHSSGDHRRAQRSATLTRLQSSQIEQRPDTVARVVGRDLIMFSGAAGDPCMSSHVCSSPRSMNSVSE